MRFEGRIHKKGRHWAIEVPVLGVVTQGRTRSNAYLMVADAIEALVNKAGFSVEVFPGDDGYFEVGSSDLAPLTALKLKREIDVQYERAYANVDQPLGKDFEGRGD